MILDELKGNRLEIIGSGYDLEWTEDYTLEGTYCLSTGEVEIRQIFKDEDHEANKIYIG